MQLRLSVQTRITQTEEAQSQVARLKKENEDLIQRVLELKSSEISRMDEVNKMCEEMVRPSGPFTTSIIVLFGGVLANNKVWAEDCSPIQWSALTT